LFVFVIGYGVEWFVYHGDILDVSADILVCPANVFLTLSGGIGGAFALRYGDSMQRRLNEFLSEKKVRHVNQGDIVEMQGNPSHFQAVLHAVAVDGFYDTNQEVMANVVESSLRRAAALDANSVALSAIGTGYGRQSIADFGFSLSRVVGMDFRPIEFVIVGLRSLSDVEEILRQLPILKQLRQV
jgi:O-acetyl-ADP-ribose deacetylase (regulator of RNase III)